MQKLYGTVIPIVTPLTEDDRIDVESLKLGVGERSDPDSDLKDHVLGKYSKADLETMRKTMERAVEAIPLILKGDVDGAMNHYNG